MTRAATQAEQFDRERDYRKHEPNPRIDQRHAVAALIGHCEAIAESGLLGEYTEQSLRLLIQKTLSAFEMPSKAERVHVRARPVGECTYCDAYRDDPMMPAHTASSRCESGKRNHCTCDICF